MVFREARSDDLCRLLELEQCVVEAERPFNPVIKPEGVRYYDFQKLMSSQDALLSVIEESGEIVCTGYIEIRPSKASFSHQKHGYLGFMFVSPEQRGKGLNQRLMDYLLEWGRGRGVTDFYLDVYAQNASAVRAYQKLGFEPLMVEMRLGD